MLLHALDVFSQIKQLRNKLTTGLNRSFQESNPVILCLWQNDSFLRTVFQVMCQVQLPEQMTGLAPDIQHMLKGASHNTVSQLLGL